MSKWLLILSVLFAGTLSATMASAAVYKWTDEEGNIHFGNTAPSQQAEKVMESTADAVGRKQERVAAYSLEERIIGTWRGMFRGEFLSLEFYERDTYKLGGKNFRLSRINNVNGKPGNAHTTIFSGIWKMEGNRVKFLRKKTGTLYRLYPEYKSALIVKQVNIAYQDIIDVIFDNNDRFQGKRYLASGHMPSYMRRR